MKVGEKFKMEYKIVNGELYHYGVKGMKWGVRKAIYKTVEKAGKGAGGNTYRAATSIKEKIKSYVTDDDYKNLDKKLKAFQEANKKVKNYDDDIDKYAAKIGTKLYKDELKRNGDAYPTERDKRKLLEYCIYDDGYSRAQKDHPEWFQKNKSADEAWIDYTVEHKKIADRILGNYGSKKIKSMTNAYHSPELRDVVAEAIESLDFDRRMNKKST